MRGGGRPPDLSGTLEGYRVIIIKAHASEENLWAPPRNYEEAGN